MLAFYFLQAHFYSKKNEKTRRKNRKKKNTENKIKIYKKTGKNKMEKIISKTGIFLAIAFIFAIIGINLVTAEQTLLLCLGNGDTLELSKCNPAIPDYTCNSDICQICVKKLNSGAYCSRSPNVCNSLGLTCSYLNGDGGGVDSEPPILIVNSPINQETYNNKKVLFDLSANEPSTFYYKYTGETKWKKLSRGDSHKSFASLREGEDEVVIRAVDSSGNIADVELLLFIDSKKPKILKTEPKNGFADGTFLVQFKEDNPSELKLHYGNEDTGMREAELDLNSCTKIKDKTTCEADVALNDYDGESIEYWFALKDIADNSAESKHLILNVDIKNPVIKNLDYTINKNRVEFNIEIEEDNFSELEYLDSGDKNPTWKMLCSKLKNNVCNVRKSFSIGEHELSIQVIDKAGNSVAESIQFTIQ